MFIRYSIFKIILRRTLVMVIGALSLPMMLLMPMSKRTKFNSYLHRYWLKTSTKPVWLKQTEKGVKELY